MSEEPKVAQQLSIEQIKEAIATNKDLEKQLVEVSLQTELGVTALDNHLASHSKSIHSEATSNAYNNVEKPLLDLGYKKPAGTLASVWIKNIVEELRETAKSPNASKVEKEEASKMIEAIKVQSSTREAELLSQIETLQKTNKEQSIKTSLNSVNLDFDASISKELISAYKGQIDAKLYASAKDVDGVITFYKEDGKPYLNGIFEPMTAKEVLTLLYAPILKKPATAGGGAGKDKPASEMRNGSIVLDPNTFNTRVNFLKVFDKACVSQGILKGTEDYYKQYAEAKEKYKTKDLPEA